MTALVLSLFIGLLGAEIHVCLPAFARWLIRRRASKLPPDLRERMLEEWLAEVEASPSHVQKVIFALGLYTGIADLLRAHGEKKLPTIHGNLNVTLTGVSATGSVGNITPEQGGLQVTGHTPSIKVISAAENLALSANPDMKIDRVQWIAGGHIASTAHVFPGSVISQQATKN